MAAIVTNKFRIHNAEQFYESFGEASASTYYVFVGRPQQFSTTTGGGTDASPPTPIDSVADEFRSFRDMMAAKKVATSDVSFVVPKRTWTAGVTYDYYRHDYSSTNQSNSGASALFDSTFYVMTSEYKVYKCMNNNSNSAVTAGNEPTATGNTEFSTGDSYVWKYMYTMTTTQVQNFLTADFMPVVDTLGTVTSGSQSTVSTNAVNGEIRHIKITTAGVGYTNGSYTGVPIRGDGASGTCTVTISGGAVTAVAVTAQGTNYTYATVHVDGITSVGTPSTSAVLTPIVGPSAGGTPVKGGHGYDALKELGAFYVMTNTSLAGTEGSGDFVVGQDFRRIGLVRNPYNHGTSTVSTAATLSALRSVTFAASPTPGTFTNDEIITGGTSGAKGVVVSWDSTNRKLYYVQTDYTGIDVNKNLTAFAGTEVVTGASSSATGTMSAVNNPEIAYHGGDVMYVEHRAPIMRASDQTENIKLVIEF